MKRLTIISHTEHYLNSDGIIVGLGSTVTEVNHLLDVFDEITHVAMLHSSLAPLNALPYKSDKIIFVPIPVVGGQTLTDKLSILGSIPKTIGIIRKCLKSSDYFQFRAPTGIGVYVIPYLILFTSRKGWFKYAGNWKQKHAPLAYRFQKRLLMHQHRKVTINGFWNDQPNHCLSFENPCLTLAELEEGTRVVLNKSFDLPINLCFVGRVEQAKGIELVFDVIEKLNDENQNKIDTIHLVGDGELIDIYKIRAEKSTVKFKFHGLLSREAVHQIYEISHAIILPSASEGFPKVITEAMNYGCLPIVSNVSSIGHYIKDGKNGFLIDQVNETGTLEVINRFLELSKDDYKVMINSGKRSMDIFTYDYYNERINSEIL